MDSYHFPIIQDKEPVRLFKSNYLEFFTHIHPAVIVAIWLPVILIFLASAIASPLPSAGPFVVPVGFLAGLFVWTFAEYMLHRFVFHYRPRSPRQERILFLFHGVHHVQPQCKSRLVMPPVVSIPLAVIFYGIFYLVLGMALKAPAWVNPTIAGFGTGYLVYDLTHYATHHFAMRGRVAKFLKRYHMQHHYKTPSMRFGVSSPLWDMVFGTRPPG